MMSLEKMSKITEWVCKVMAEDIFDENSTVDPLDKLALAELQLEHMKKLEKIYDKYQQGPAKSEEKEVDLGVFFKKYGKDEWGNA